MILLEKTYTVFTKKKCFPEIVIFGLYVVFRDIAFTVNGFGGAGARFMAYCLNTSFIADLIAVCIVA